MRTRPTRSKSHRPKVSDTEHAQIQRRNELRRLNRREREIRRLILKLDNSLHTSERALIAFCRRTLIALGAGDALHNSAAAVNE